MKLVKLSLIAAEISALICIALLQFAEVECNPLDRGIFTMMFAGIAVGIQSIQQNIKW